MSSSIGQGLENGHVCPPCLRRLAPAIVVIQDEKRRRPRDCSGGALLVAKRRYQIRVIPAAGEHLVSVSLSPDEHIRPLGPTQDHHLGDGRTEYVLHFKTTGFLRPWPVQARISIVLNHSQWGNYTKELPVIVWPSMLNRFAWAFSTVAGTLWPSHLAQAAIADGHLRPLPDIVAHISDSRDLALITGAAIAGFAVIAYFGNWTTQLLFSSDAV